MSAIEKYYRNEAGRAIDIIQNFADRVGSTMSQIQGYLGTMFEVAKNGETFVGLQYSAIEPIRSSIRTYVTNVRNVVAKLNSEASNANAVKGEAAEATKLFVKAVSDMAERFVTQLLAYSDKMYEYGESYKKNDSNLAQNITQESNALSNENEEYVEKY